MWRMTMVSEDYLGLNDQAVSLSNLLKSHLSFKYKCFNNSNCKVLFSIQLVAFEAIYNCGIPNHGILAPK